MRPLQLATFALLGIGSAAYLAHAQSVDSTTATGASGNSGMHEPFSKRASNIEASDTRSNIAPALPTPPVGDSAPVRDYLRAAHDALVAGRTGEAQESLEMAETRALDRSVDPETANTADPNPRVTQIQNALQVLGQGDRGQALQIIDAMAD
ncbi:MAG: hypothetical protein ABSA58_15590 [Acetobacteraceae bacterium]|jgi:hypothetical protein